MNKTPLCYPKFLLPLLSLFTSLPFLVISQSLSSDQEILLNIKEQWGNQPPMDSWNSTTSPCQWPGIQCIDDDETVIGIFLDTQGIAGEIPPSVCDLKNLTTLDLMNNSITGQFPTFLYNCTKLQYLDLSRNNLAGRLPNDINRLSPDLQHFFLNSNNFIGIIPSSIVQLKGLITLHLQANSFNGTFPFELGHLGSLEDLALAYNPFPPMRLPSEFKLLKSLKSLWMKQCNLIGEIPESLSDLSNLEFLDLVGNNLEGGIPSGLFLLKNLTILYLYRNRLNGEIPTSIEALNLLELDISENNLTGTIPKSIGKLPKLELLSLYGNQIHGEIPSTISLMPNLKTLLLFRNRLSGSLPPELGLRTTLGTVEVSDNSLTGQLPENLCSGRTLTGVVAYNNYLNGPIPSSLGKCHSLVTVQLDNNSFSGKVPEGLWTLKNMWWLKLSNNRFSGQIPVRLGGNLTRLEIKNNRFTGKIPRSIGSWENLIVFEASNNFITGTVPLELTNLSHLNTLLLDGNQLSGKLPSNIISWKNLNILSLARNKLSGSIPSALGSLSVLNNLDLSDNRFSGKIPTLLGHLKLSSLNLSSNKLTGRIPYGFDNNAYEYSFLDTNLCSDNRISNLPNCAVFLQDGKNLSSKYVALIAVIAVVVLLAASYFTLFIIRKLRQKKHNQEKLASWKLTSFHKLDFTEKIILANLTDNYVIGSGGFGKVYRIPINQSGDNVAVKRIWNSRKLSHELEKQFVSEVEILGTIRHANIVKLLCCVSSEDSKLLVYEYMENQSLDKWLRRDKGTFESSFTNNSDHNSVLDWPTRLRIAIGAAKGLCYMHHDCSPAIIHRDVKSSNILLDTEFNAKIADFGLAKMSADKKGAPHTASAVAGSFGYIAPEYWRTRRLNEKIDIYSFGVVLLELATGKEPCKRNDHLNLAEWSWQHYSEGHPIERALDDELKEPRFLEDMRNVFKLGLMCTSMNPCSRPSMKQVLKLLILCSSHEASDTRIQIRHEGEDGITPFLGSNNIST